MFLVFKATQQISASYIRFVKVNAELVSRIQLRLEILDFSKHLGFGLVAVFILCEESVASLGALVKTVSFKGPVSAIHDDLRSVVNMGGIIKIELEDVN